MSDPATAAARSMLAGAGFGGPHLDRLTERFLAEVAPVLTVPATAADRAARLAAALDLAAAHLPAVTGSTVPGLHGGAPLSFLSFRSHAEGFLATTRDPAAARLALDRQYEAVRDTVDQRVAGVIAQLRGTGPEVSTAAATWFGAVRAAKPAMAEAFGSGRLTIAADPTGPAGDSPDRGPLEHSAFHRVVGSSPALLRYLGSDPGFLATRLLTTLLYLGLHTMGLPLVERYFLCHATARACETVFGVDAGAVLATLTTGPNPAGLRPVG